MANRIQLRRDGAQQWANVNPILAQGELGIEIDTSRIKIGDGVTAWNSLKYERPIETESNTANTLVKRNADGNFEAGAITASLIGNASTATRLANARTIGLGGDMSGSGTFDGSSNLTITAELNYVPALPHYDPANLDATGTYTRITVDSRGRIVDADSPTTLTDFGIADAQPLDTDLTSLANMTGFGFISRQAEGTLVNRTITGGSGRIIVQNGNAQTANPFIDLADTTVVVGRYNPITSMDPLVNPRISATTGEQTVNTCNIQVDRYGRLIYANTSPIATATQGAKSGTSFTTYDNSTAYPRFSKIIASNGRCYQAAIRDIPAGLGEPTHNTQLGAADDQGGWRDLGTDAVEQKGLASFDQEDFDVDANGHVTIADRAIENSQLQSLGRLMFTDQNVTETFELDPERTVNNAYHGITAINHVNINNRTGISVFRVVGYNTAEYPYQPGILPQGSSYPAVAADAQYGNGSADWGSSLTGAIDINLDTTVSGNITLDVSKTNQFIKRTSGNVDFHLQVNEAASRNLNVFAENANAGGLANINIIADNEITITSTDGNYFVNVEDYRFQQNTLSTRNATMILDPGDDDAVTGLVIVRGDLQVDGVTTTVNSVVMTVQDPIITLGGEDTLTSDDNKDRGIEFRYYDTQERFGFFGWDENYANANIWSGTGGYRFLYNATNTNEVFTGTDAALIAGNLRLTTNTNSTSTTTGTLVVTGGFGLSGNAHVGGNVTIADYLEVNDSIILKSDNEDFLIQTAAGVTKFSVDSDTGNTVIEGTLDVQLETEITDNLIISADAKEFIIRTAAGVNKFTVDTDNGNTDIQGTAHIVGAVDLDNTLNVDSAVTFNSTLDVDDDVVFHNDFLMDVSGKFFTITNGTSQTFRVTSANGNTDIEGSLNIGGFNTFERTNNIVVDATTSESDITLTTQGNATFAGGVNIEKDVRIATDLYVADRIVVKDAGTARTRPSLLNNLDVKYRQYIGGSAAHNASFADDADANLRIAGGVGIVQDLHVGDDFYVGKVGSLDTIEFSILGESGYTTIGRVGQGNATDGALVVHGDATFNREFNITGYNTTIGDAATDAFSINATSTFNAPVTISGSNNLSVGGNITVTGNLTVNGSTTTVNSTTITVDDPIITLGGDTVPVSDDTKDRGVEFRYYASGAARIGFFGWDNSAGRYTFFNAATNSSEVFSGTRSGIDAGSLKLFDTTNATNSASGTLIVGGGAGIGLKLFVGTDLSVGGTASITGATTMSSTLSVADDFNVSTTFTVDAQTGNTFANGTFTVNGNSVIGNAGSDSHTINGTVLFNHAITSTDITADQIKIGVDASNEISTTAGNLILDSFSGTVNITDNADIDGDLNVDGNTLLVGTLAVNGNTTIGNQSTDAHTVNGTVQFNQALTGSARANIRNLKIGTDADNEIGTLAGNLVLDSTTGLTYVDDNLQVVGTLVVGGNATIGDAGTDAHTVNGTVTFNNPITSTDITADNIKIGVDGSSEISTTAGNLTLDSATGSTIIDDNLSVTGTIVSTGLITANAGLTISGSTGAGEDFIITDGTNTKFSVTSSAGNTLISGTLGVTGATSFSSTTAHTGAATFSSTASIAGDVNITSTTNPNIGAVFLNLQTPAFKVAGGAQVGGKMAVGQDLTVFGNFEVVGSVSTSGNQAFSGRVSFSKNETPTTLTGNAPLMVTSGGATIATDLFVGDDIFIGPNAATKISLFGATGNATFAGTLGVTGATTLTTLACSTITASGSANITGSLLINTNKFTVTASTGNTAIAGTLNVTGATIIAGNLTVNNPVDFDSTLNVDGAATFNNTITQNSTSLFKDNFVLQGASKVLQLKDGAGNVKVELQSTTGNITANGLISTSTLATSSNATIGGTLGVTGQITGNVTGNLTGTADKTNLVNITETAASSLTYYIPFVSANTGYTEVRTDSSNLTYNPSTNTLQVNNFKSTTDFEVQGNLNVTGNITFFQSQVGSIANHTTDALAEGSTNLYFTNERVDDRVAALVNGGTGISAVYDDANNVLGLSVDFGEISTSNLTEGTNLFFTNARARAAISASGSLSYDSGTGVISYTTPTTIASLSNHTTTALAEGTNLYYTDERVDDRVSSLIVGGTGISSTYNDAGNSLTLAVDFTEFSTTNITEGTNQYFTTARARSSISVSGSLSYSSSTGVISYTAPTLATVATTGAYSDLSGRPTISTFGASLIDDADAATARATLGLGTAATTNSTAYATAAQGTAADDTNSDLTALYSALNAIGNDAGIATVAQLKAALAALTRP